MATETKLIDLLLEAVKVSQRAVEVEDARNMGDIDRLATFAREDGLAHLSADKYVRELNALAEGLRLAALDKAQQQPAGGG